MRKTTRILSWALPLLFLIPAASAQVSTCTRALGEAYLDINNVRARILNGGGLFYRGEPHVYEVPKGSGSNAIFASGIWLAGEVGGQLRAAATRYGEWEFWAGPLDDNGEAPVDCTVFDRVYKVSRDDVGDYEAGLGLNPDLRDWPTGLGAPTYDADGNMIDILDQPLAARVDRKIDLAAGERPAILGDQTIWWVMNDRGNTHNSTDAPPIGVEVHGTAFAFNTAGYIGDATFYKYNIFYRGTVPLENAYMGIFSDPDLGNFDDDLVGSDTTLGVGFVYNADNEDEGGEGYGTPPPAAGYDFFQGPVVPGAPTDTAHARGQRFPGFKNLPMTTFVFYNNGGGVTEDPQTGEDYYNYMKGFWKDGKRITFGGSGRDFSEIPTNFMYPGDPATGQYWSEVNSDDQGTAIDPGDRRFVMSTGPFTINPDDQQEIVFGVVFAKGADNLDSVNELRKADALAQAAFDVDFQLPAPPSAPTVSVTELDGQVILEWSNSARSNNYLESYSESDPFAPDEDKNYEFEGYDVIQYNDVADQVGKVIATYDVVNGVMRVIDGAPGDVQEVTSTGTDSGVQRYHAVGGLTNYKEYHFGVQAFAYNEPSFPKVYRGPIARVTVIPTKSRQILSDSAFELAASTSGDDFEAEAGAANVGEGIVTADLINPGKVQNAVYTVEFYEHPGEEGRVAPAPPSPEELNEIDALSPEEYAAGKSAAGGCTTYDVKRDGTVLFNGSETDDCAPQVANVVQVDGMVFTILGPEPGIKHVSVPFNAAGAVDPPDMGAYGFNSSGWGFVDPDGTGPYPDPDRPTRGVQQSTNDEVWGLATGPSSGCVGGTGGCGDYESFVVRSMRAGPDVVGVYDYEMRFDYDNPGKAYRRFNDGVVVDVPFTLWRTGIATPDDPSDDVQMLPAILDDCGDVDAYEVCGDHAASGGDNDPYTDWIYWGLPTDTSPGSTGYTCFFFGSPCPNVPYEEEDFHEVFARTVLVNWNGGQTVIDDQTLPEGGTVFRITTLKPSQPGDVFSIDAGALGVGASDRSELEEKAALDLIGIVPNPYKGASAYERSQLIDEVRFTNMPEVATVRVFTLNGTLIKTLEKQGPDRTLKWNLTTDNDLPIASGVYLIHVDVPNVGEKVLKFAAVKKRIQLNTF